MLLREPGLYGPAVSVKGENGGSRGLCHKEAWPVQKEQQAADQGHSSGNCEETFLHECIVCVEQLKEQCMAPHAAAFVPHGVNVRVSTT